MFTRKFIRAQPLILAHEGGFVDHPKDPGGATNQGVTQGTYNSWRKSQGHAQRSVRMLTVEERDTIYFTKYWLLIRGDDLPDGLAYCVYDAAVNSGPARAARWLQRLIGAKRDGLIGPATLQALTAHTGSTKDLIDDYCDYRLAFMKRLKHWGTFKGGWTRRVAEVRAEANTFAAGAIPIAASAPSQGKADGPDAITTSVMDAAKNPASLAAVGGLLGSAGTLASGDGPVQWAIGAVLVIGVLAALVWLLRRDNRRTE